MAKFKVPFFGRNTVNITVHLMHILLAQKLFINVSLANKRRTFLYHWNPIQIHSGEMHYARIPA
jgi:hypothetical protein